MHEFQTASPRDAGDAPGPATDARIDPTAARRARRDARARREHRPGRVAQMRFLALIGASVLGTSALAAPVAAFESQFEGTLVVLMHAASSFLG